MCLDCVAAFSADVGSDVFFLPEMIFSVLGDEIEFAVGVSLSGEAGGLARVSVSVVSGGSLLYVLSVWNRPSFTIPSQLEEVPLVNLSALVPASLAAVMALSQYCCRSVARQNRLARGISSRHLHSEGRDTRPRSSCLSTSRKTSSRASSLIVPLV